MGRAHNRDHDIGVLTRRRAEDYSTAFAAVLGSARGTSEASPERDLIGSARFRNRRRLLRFFGESDERLKDEKYGAYRVGCAYGYGSKGASFMAVDGAYYDLDDALDVLTAGWSRAVLPADYADYCYIGLDDEDAPVFVAGALGGGAAQMYPTGLTLHDKLTVETLMAAIAKTRGLLPRA